MKLRNRTFVSALCIVLLVCILGLDGARTAQPAAQKKPNIVIIWGDDIGQSDIIAYTMGLMGFHTPNIDRVAKEGIIFTDYYGEQSCTPAGRRSSPASPACAPA